MVDTPLQQQTMRRLRAAGIAPTLQRVVVAMVLLPYRVHLTAEQILALAREQMPEISRATVYSTVQMFARHGLLRTLYVDGEATVYDSNPTPHHHLYYVDTGEVRDLPAEALRFHCEPTLPAELEVDSIDIVVRVRNRACAVEHSG